MTIRKFLKKLLLVSTAIFWAGCNDDNGTAPDTTPTERSSSIEQSNASSSVEKVSSSSAEEVSSSSAEGTSSSSVPNACKNTDAYPYVKAGTDLRCKEIIRDSYAAYFQCCDKSFYLRNLDQIRNDTLLSDSIIKAEKIDSLQATYCKGNGGVADYSTYKPGKYDISVDECNDIAKDKAKNFFADSASFTESESVESCIKFLSEEVYMYGSIMEDFADSLATVTCADGTTIDTDAYTKAKNDYNQRIVQCDALGQEIIDRINTCIAEAEASSSSVANSESSSSSDPIKRDYSSL